MPNGFCKYKKNQRLVPVEINNKDRYFTDLYNIEHSFTGRDDACFANTFLIECVQLVINSISLFEMGYFDCAYYSLRQSLELSTTMVYLFDIKEPEKEESLKKWKNEERFPMQKQMFDYMKEKGFIFKDLKVKLDLYFERLDKVKSKLNKFVHKQGIDKFYVCRNHPVNGIKSREEFINEFEEYLKKCIGAIAVFRLGIDPFPVLLNDNEIYHRAEDSFTSPYSDEFIESYIGHDIIEKYKETEIYQEYYQAEKNKEKREESVTDVIISNYVDIENIEEILKQKHLISDMDLMVVLICKASEKVAKIYTFSGLKQYFTSRKTVRTKLSWDGRDFENIKRYKPSSNIPYDEAFITHVVFLGKDYFIEHNESFSDDELETIKAIAQQALE